jgi:RNA polymerase sigma-70 factor (ECF subfamily)
MASPVGREPGKPDNPAQALEQGERASQVGEALQRLPEEQRAAVSLAFYGGLTHEQVAEQQAIPLGTAKTRIRLAMKRLREILQN